MSVVGKSYWKLESKITSLDESQSPKRQIGNIRNLSAALIWNNKHFLMKQTEFTKPQPHRLRKWRGTPKNSIIVSLNVVKKLAPEAKQTRGERSQNQITVCFGESGAGRLSQAENMARLFSPLLVAES